MSWKHPGRSASAGLLAATAQSAGVYWEIEKTGGGSIGDGGVGILHGNANLSGLFYQESDVIAIRGSNGNIYAQGSDTGFSIGAYGNDDRIGFLVIGDGVWINKAGTWANSGKPVARLPASATTRKPVVQSYTGYTYQFFFTEGLEHLPSGYAIAFDGGGLNILENDGGSIDGNEVTGRCIARSVNSLPILAMS
jgi:hypothetical protein